MKVTETELAGAFLIEPDIHADDRGFFVETYNNALMSPMTGPMEWVQDNHSRSNPKGTVRGLHFQAPPHAQAKLVRCGRGRVFDVAVDIRKGSPTFGKWTGAELSAENGRQLLIPEGFLHGFVTREPESELLYKCSDYYDPACDGAVRFDDQGRKYDAKGNLTDWWTEHDAKEFERRSQCFVDQYAGYTATGDLKLNGKLTLGENVADNGGVVLALMALRSRLQGKPAEKIDGFTPEQRFFINFAQCWRGKIRDEAQKMYLATDPHSPDIFRINGTVSNLPEFIEAFGCKPDAQGVRPVSIRVNIW